MPEGADSIRFRVDAGSWQNVCRQEGNLFRFSLSGVRPWDEENPELHTLEVDTGTETVIRRFGVRSLTRQGRKLMINGREMYLRGRHDGMAFPETGYAPMDVNSWRTHLKKAQAYGLNHVRFHTCCPPEAAFEAADELGMYLEPELPFWGTAEPGAVQDWLDREGLRILRAYSAHPSFVCLSLGNELWGDEMCLRNRLKRFREEEAGIFYTAGSNNYQFSPRIFPEEDLFVGVRLQKHRLIRGSYAMCDAPLGIVQTTEPESVSSFDRMVTCPEEVEKKEKPIQVQAGTGVAEVEDRSESALIPEIPVIAHEVGQYSFYPDFREEKRYTGPLKAGYLDVFRKRLQAAGLYADHEMYFQAAGQLALACYRREIETFLRSGEISGFQLLDLQDFPGQGIALVGLLNARMEEKGFIAPEAFRRFCGDPVVLAGLEKFWTLPGAFPVRVFLSDLRGRAGRKVRAELLRGEEVLDCAVSEVPLKPGRLREGNPVTLHAPQTEYPEELGIRLCTEEGLENRYRFWVFPENREVRITENSIETPQRSLVFGRDLEVTAPEGRPGAEYATDFWNYTMFAGISRSMGKPEPAGTLGLCIREHPLLKGFVPGPGTTPPWHPILSIAHLDGIAAPGIVEMIDNWERCQRLGLLYEEEDRVKCTVRFWEKPEHPVVRALARSLAEALGREKTSC